MEPRALSLPFVHFHKVERTVSLVSWQPSRFTDTCSHASASPNTSKFLLPKGEKASLFALSSPHLLVPLLLSAMPPTFHPPQQQRTLLDSLAFLFGCLCLSLLYASTRAPSKIYAFPAQHLLSSAIKLKRPLSQTHAENNSQNGSFPPLLAPVPVPPPPPPLPTHMVCARRSCQWWPPRPPFPSLLQGLQPKCHCPGDLGWPKPMLRLMDWGQVLQGQGGRGLLGQCLTRRQRGSSPLLGLTQVRGLTIRRNSLSAPLSLLDNSTSPS